MTETPASTEIGDQAAYAAAVQTAVAASGRYSGSASRPSPRRSFGKRVAAFL
ncbi:hypothetical protein [Actinomadura sp. 7K507]|uniref:hypothetical protein n=1 Tax=Actinomadura sp. 7K507 TaxID=2530365 RepID=UPI001404E1AC|nr:hypothetical protein [Actinomadura sp. 7K507]